MKNITWQGGSMCEVYKTKIYFIFIYSACEAKKLSKKQT